MMKVQYYFLLFILVGLILCTGNSPLQAEEISNNKEKFTWLNAGIGASSFGVSLGANFTFQSGKSLISIRYIFNGEFNMWSTPPESVWDVGLLYGRISKGTYALASIAGGISIVGGVRRGKAKQYIFPIFEKYEERHFSTFGFPIEVQLFLTPSSFLGFGIYGFANFNSEESFAGALLCVQIGKLR